MFFNDVAANKHWYMFPLHTLSLYASFTHADSF